MSSMTYLDMKQFLLSVLLLLVNSQAMADELLVAVASNFADSLKHISAMFEQDTGHRVKISIGSTGKHYAQIKNGAPFDILFAADVRRPALLEQQSLAIKNTRFTYALGKLVLWSPKPGLVDAQGRVLERDGFHFLAIANPKLAPYGKAAQEVVQSRGLWSSLTGKMVRGENIGQTYQFVKSGNAELGFVALSQVKRPGLPIQGSFWDVPQGYYSVIEQQAVLLKDNEVSRTFLCYVRSSDVVQMIRDYGYDTP